MINFLKLGTHRFSPLHIVAVNTETTMLDGQPAIAIWLSHDTEPWVFSRKDPDVQAFVAWIDANLSQQPKQRAASTTNLVATMKNQGDTK